MVRNGSGNAAGFALYCRLDYKPKPCELKHTVTVETFIPSLSLRPYTKAHIRLFDDKKDRIMDQLLMLGLLATMLMALYITPGQTTSEEIEVIDALVSVETKI